MPDPVRDPMSAQDGDLFHVTPFEPLPHDGPQVIFLVTNLRTGVPREITVTLDAQGFAEFIVDGDKFYDAETESPYVTVGLYDSTVQTLARVRDAHTKADRIIAINSMRPLTGEPGPVN